MLIPTVDHLIANIIPAACDHNDAEVEGLITFYLILVQ
jgi:hypothetical protein